MERRFFIEVYNASFQVTDEAYFDLDMITEARQWMDAHDKPGSHMVCQVVEVCPHGVKPEDCDPCAVASDHAYDAAREDRFFGRGR